MTFTSHEESYGETGKTGLKQLQVQEDIFKLDGTFVSQVIIVYWISRSQKENIL